MRSRRVLSWFLGNTAITVLGIVSLLGGGGVALAQTASSLEGTLEILHDDTRAGARFEYFIHTNNGRYALHFRGKPPTNLLTGARIRAKGLLTGNTLDLAPNSSDVQTVTSAPSLNPLGEQRTLLILVNFSDAPTQPYTPDVARSVMFNTTSRFYLENSFQQTWFTGDVVGWFTIAATSTVCDTFAITTQAEAAASAAGINVAAYPRRVYAFPQNDACLFWGKSTIGGNPSRAWINGDFELGVTAHELGHGFGLWHSHAMDCDTAAVGATCTTYEYGDNVDIMGGSSRYAHFNAFQKENLGWLNAGASPPMTTVTASGTYTLEAYELAGSGPKALKILKSVDPTTGERTWYYVESRQAIGFDAGLATDGFLLPTNTLNGLLIRSGNYSQGSFLLDMTPASQSSYLDWSDPALPVGQTFTDPAAGVSVTADWVTATQASVTVQLAGGSTPTGPALVSVATDRSSYTPGQTVAMTATVKTSNGSPVAKASVTFAVTKSNGVVVAGSASTDSNGVATYKLRLKQQDPRGSYEADATATKVAPSAKASAKFMVQ
jgi:MG2 domain/Gametolysin peptidase M11